VLSYIYHSIFRLLAYISIIEARDAAEGKGISIIEARDAAEGKGISIIEARDAAEGKGN
jgi:hypothetical protein